MKRISIFLLSSVAAMGCSRDNASEGKELAALKVGVDKLHASQGKILEDQGKILKQQDTILAAIKAGGARAPARPQRPQRPRPNPSSVYSVDINGAPFKGAKNAKVTIVEAFEFA